MRKWLILFVVLILGVIGLLWWLGNQVDQSMPEDGEVRMEIDNVFRDKIDRERREKYETRKILCTKCCKVMFRGKENAMI